MGGVRTKDLVHLWAVVLVVNLMILLRVTFILSHFLGKTKKRSRTIDLTENMA